MPVKKINAAVSPSHDQFVSDLSAEWRQPTTSSDAPVIIEQANPPSNAIHIYVVWQRWQEIDQVERGEIIMDSAEQVKQLDEMLRITQAWGLTPEQADDLKLQWR